MHSTAELHSQSMTDRSLTAICKALNLRSVSNLTTTYSRNNQPSWLQNKPKSFELSGVVITKQEIARLSDDKLILNVNSEVTINDWFSFFKMLPKDCVPVEVTGDAQAIVNFRQLSHNIEAKIKLYKHKELMDYAIQLMELDTQRQKILIKAKADFFNNILLADDDQKIVDAYDKLKSTVQDQFKEEGFSYHINYTTRRVLLGVVGVLYGIFMTLCTLGYFAYDIATNDLQRAIYYRSFIPDSYKDFSQSKLLFLGSHNETGHLGIIESELPQIFL